MVTVQAAVVAAITQAIALLVAFAVINSTQAGVIVATTVAVVNAAFLIANAIENHGKAPAPVKLPGVSTK
jgi:hypothetical protein